MNDLGKDPKYSKKIIQIERIAQVDGGEKDPE